jgi:hypothetical protein
VRSITTDAEQRLLFDRARIKDVAGRRVAIVDDVISTGASTGTALRLLRGVGAEIVAIGTLVTEASIWRTVVGRRRRRWCARSVRFRSFAPTGRAASSRTGSARPPPSRGSGVGLRRRLESWCLATWRARCPVTFSSTK